MFVSLNSCACYNNLASLNLVLRGNASCTSNTLSQNHAIRVHHNYLSCSACTIPSKFSRVLPLTFQNYYIPFCVTVYQAHKEMVVDVLSSMLIDLTRISSFICFSTFYTALKSWSVHL